MSHGFCSKFRWLCGGKILKSLRFDKVRECLEVGTFFEAQFRIKFLRTFV